MHHNYTQHNSKNMTHRKMTLCITTLSIRTPCVVLSVVVPSVMFLNFAKCHGAEFGHTKLQLITDFIQRTARGGFVEDISQTYV